MVAGLLHLSTEDRVNLCSYNANTCGDKVRGHIVHRTVLHPRRARTNSTPLPMQSWNKRNATPNCSAATTLCSVAKFSSLHWDFLSPQAELSQVREAQAPLQKSGNESETQPGQVSATTDLHDSKCPDTTSDPETGSCPGTNCKLTEKIALPQPLETVQWQWPSNASKPRGHG